MNITVLQPGATGADYSAWRPSAAELKALGFSFVVRYIAPGDQTRVKVVSKEEIAALHAGGIAVLIVFEWRVTDAFGGAKQGNEYGLWAKNKLQELGYPKGLACIVAVDTDSLQSTTLSTIEAYLRAFAHALAPDYKLGVYGGTRVMSRVKDVSVLNWQANARSWSPFGFLVPVHAKQGTQEPGHRFDPNTVKLPIAAWLPVAGPVYPAWNPPKSFGAWPYKKKPTIAPGQTHRAVAYATTVIFFKAGGNIHRTMTLDAQALKRVKDLQTMFHITDEPGIGPKTWAAIDFLAVQK